MSTPDPDTAVENCLEISNLKAELVLAKERAKSAESRLRTAKKELNLMIDEQEDVERRKASELAEELHQAKIGLESWRVQFMQRELDNDVLSNRVAELEHKLNQSVQPLAFDDQALVKEREMTRLALTDRLTGLANSNKLDIALAERIAQSQAGGPAVVLLVLNIDGFRQINEFLGWGAGNDLLVQIAQRLRAQIPQNNLISRRSVDEFAIVTVVDSPLGQSAGRESPMVRTRQIIDFLMQIISAPFSIGGRQLPISCSIGVSVYPEDSDSSEEMLENAYSALALAKKAGGGQYSFFDDKRYADREHQALLAMELSEAVKSDALTVLYRPVAEAGRGILAAGIVEVYWDHPTQGRIEQSVFMPIALEQSVDSLVVEKIVAAGCEISRKLRGATPMVMKLPESILREANFLKWFLDEVAKHRIRPESLILELPQEALAKSPARVLSFFHQLAKWKIGGSVGGLGDGPLDIATLLSCSPSLVSLSKSLMEDVPNNEAKKNLLLALVDMAKRLSLPILVEGALTNPQAHLLALHEVNWIAGDYVSPSLTLADFVARRRTTWKFT